jgi:secreted trypsin-like serine protease
VDDDDIPEHSVREVIVHHHWKHNDESFDADISLIVLSMQKDLSDSRVGVACLPPTNSWGCPSLGTIFGWGITENSTEHFESTPSELVIPVVSKLQCFAADQRFVITSSNRTFCAGFVKQNKTVCHGDSGGGFFTVDQQTKAINVFGIISASLNNPYGDCISSMYSVFTKVNKFSSWIQQKMDETMKTKLSNVQFNCHLYNSDET